MSVNHLLLKISTLLFILDQFRFMINATDNIKGVKRQTSNKNLLGSTGCHEMTLKLLKH